MTSNKHLFHVKFEKEIAALGFTHLSFVDLASGVQNAFVYQHNMSTQTYVYLDAVDLSADGVSLQVYVEAVRQYALSNMDIVCYYMRQATFGENRYTFDLIRQRYLHLVNESQFVRYLEQLKKF